MHPNSISTTPNFRCTRRTNDGVGWSFALFASAFTSLWLVGLWGNILKGDKEQVGFGVVGLFFLVPLTAFCWKIVLFPWECELVIENHTIRWGNTDRRDQQTSKRISQVKRWVFDQFERELFAYAECFALERIGHGVLNEPRMKEVIRFLEQQYPEIPVVDRSGEKITL